MNLKRVNRCLASIMPAFETFAAESNNYLQKPNDDSNYILRDEHR